MVEKAEKPTLPPYIPYKTFFNFINGLKDSGIPQQVDKSVLRSMSGAMQSATISALKFLDLIDGQAKPTKKLTQLVDASNESYSQALEYVLSESYSFLFENDFNLEQATGTQVQEKFRVKGASGSTITKCIAFFLTAAKAAKIKVSSHVRPPIPTRSNAQRKVNPKKAEGGLNVPPPPLLPKPQLGWHEQLLAKFPSFDPAWDEETRKEWFKAFNELMSKGRGDAS